MRHDEIRELVGPGGVDVVRRGNAREWRHGQSKARRERRCEHYRRLIAHLEFDGNITVNAAGAGVSSGSLQAGSYRVMAGYVSAAGVAMLSGEPSAFVVAAGNIPRITFPPCRQALPASISI